MREGMLADLTVLDFTHHIAGPFCTRLLADLGARVIKIERPGMGDPARALGPFPDDHPHPEKSGTFLDLNTGKESVTLDLKHPRGREIALQLAAHADLVVENFRPRVMQSLGLGFDALAAFNPRLVLCSISTFGQNGPLRDAPATELTVHVMGARFTEMGLRPRPPLRMAPHASAYLAGLTAATACLAALADPEPAPRHLDVAVLDALVAATNRQYAQYSFTGINLPRAAAARPAQVLRAADGHVVFTLALGWDRICAMLERPDLLNDERFRSLAGRMAHAEELDAVISDWALDLPKQEVFRRAQAARVAAAPVQSVADLLADPQYQARGFFQEIAHPQAGRLTHPGHPFHATEPPATRQPAPTLGQHTEAVLRELCGFDDDTITDLRREGAI
jgi:crotonobetainyl-CoA:carnitine CoA-transferase CaiB-like acyl-CoA transferase